ncbi:MAG: hypothetical protein C5B52_14975 [Bacteroidetes bacterium]|nr:MAG: hypothetical protein C5B52_14975 [Bacteroidota bacterium]
MCSIHAFTNLIKMKLFTRFVGQLFLLIASTYISQTSFTQTRAFGKVLDQQGNPLASVNVLLLAASDSSLVKGIVTDHDGLYEFQNINSGKFLLSYSYIGFQQMFSSPFHTWEKNEIDLGSVNLLESKVQLNTVTISAKKPLLEQKIDRMVINVQNSIVSSGSSALDILERSPGISVNRQSNIISMNGKDGVQVMINGKMSYMPMEALVQTLAGINSSNIEKIELITTPPANMDAAGNAGFINIVLIANTNFGTNVNVSGTLGYSVGVNAQASVNFNHRQGKFNFYGDYSVLHEKYLQRIDFYRQFMYQGKNIESEGESIRDAQQTNHNMRIGLDYQLGKKTVLGILGAGYLNKWTMDANATNDIQSDKLVDTTIKMKTDEINQWNHVMGNLNLEHSFSNNGKLLADVDYIYYHDNNPSNYKSDWYDGSMKFLYNENMAVQKQTPINIFVVNTDYSMKLGKAVDWEAGLKYTSSKFRNNVSLDRQEGNDWKRDEDLSAKYNLLEWIAAGYSSFNIQANAKTSLKFGLRYEFTRSNLRSEKQANVVDRRYGNFFPTVFISRKLNDDQSLNLGYSRRISRPTFNDMAPWVIFVDPNTFFSGNPALQPSITDNFKIDYLIKKLVFSLSYSYDNNPIAFMQSRVDTVRDKQILASDNMDYMHTVIFNLIAPVNVGDWWTMQWNVSATVQKGRAFNNKVPFELSQNYFRVSLNQTIKLPRDFAIDIYGQYLSKSLIGVYVREPYGVVDIGVQKKVKGNSGKLRLVLHDIFNTGGCRKVEAQLSEQNLNVKFSGQFEKRTISLTYSRSFGKNSLKAKRERGTGSEEELGRVQ